MSHQYSKICNICGENIFIPFYKNDRENIVEIKQRGKYGRMIYLHLECYKNQLKENQRNDHNNC